MAVIKPFRAIRPNPDLAHLIAALPYDVMNTAEARKMTAGNPYSFLRIDRPEINFPDPIDPYQPQVYEKASTILQQMLADKQYIMDQKECLYIYRQIMDGRSQTGLVCCTSVDDYINDVIKKHEFTRPEKEIDRVNHVEALSAHTGPILQTYPDHEQIKAIIDHWIDTHAPVYQFTAYDVEQICWVIDQEEVIAQLKELFAAVPHLYIADGHHRSAAAQRVALKKRQENPNFTGDEEFNYFLSVLFPASELMIMPYNRVVQDLNGLSEQEFFARIRERFELDAAPTQPYQPEVPHTFGMYLGSTWYKLTAKPEIIPENDPVNRLDAAVLQNNLLEPVLGIADPRTDERIDFIGGIRGLTELERRVHTDMTVAFSLYPTAIEEVISVADAGMVMPPKSTWFEPKLLSGLFIHQI